MQIQTDKLLSIIIPTRERRGMAEKCIQLYLSKAEHPEKIEIILIIDHDDQSMYGFGDWIIKNNFIKNIRIISVQRSEKFLVRDYFNYGAQCSTGKFIWITNDDFEIQTERWDTIVTEAIESFCSSKGDRVAYVMVHDDTHAHSKEVLMRDGCCCPILTREVAEVLNGAVPEELPASAADIILYNIFKRLPESRTIDLSDKVKLLHLQYDGRMERDAIHARLHTMGGYQFTESEMEDYTYRIRHIMKPTIIKGHLV